MKNKQEQIEEMAFSSCVVPHKTIQFLSNYMQKESIKFESCRVCEFYNSCQRIKDIESFYKAGYRKASEIIGKFVERLEKYIGSRNDLWDEDRPEFDEEFVRFGIQIVADEMRQEVENGI